MLDNELLKDSLINTVNELFFSRGKETATLFIDELAKLRQDINLTMLDNDYIKKYIWSVFRNDNLLIQTLMYTASAFLQPLGHLTIEYLRVFTRTVVPFNSHSTIVDEECMGKAVDPQELATILSNNYWLFFIIYALTNMRLVNEVLAEHISKGK